MPKKEHIHIVTNSKYKQILENLGQKYGSMTKAFEAALDIIDKNESLSSCTECEIKYRYELENSFHELFNMVIFSADSIRELIKYLRGDITVAEYVLNLRKVSYEFAKQYLNHLKIQPKNEYEDLLSMMEEWRKVTRLFSAIQVDKFNSKIIGQVNVFENLPILAAMGLIGYLEAFKFTFDIDIVEKDIIIKWINPEKYPSSSVKIEEKIQTYIREARLTFKPYLVKQGFLFASPRYLDWIAENLFDFKVVPIDVSLHVSLATSGGFQLITNPLEMARIGENMVIQTNYADQVDIKVNEEDQTFTLAFTCQMPHLTRTAFQGLIINLSKFGWKLQKHRIDHKFIEVTFQYVGPDDPTILDPLFLNNFMAYLNQRFQKLRVVPVDEYDSLTSALYDSDPEKFQEVFRKQGIKLANALKLLGKNDPAKMREIGFSALPQFLQQTERDINLINMIAESDKVTMIFKTSNIIELEIFKALISSLFEEIGYQNIKARIIENMLTIEFTRSTPIEASTFTFQ